MPDRQTTEYSATQLVYSIKFKLSHANTIIDSHFSGRLWQWQPMSSRLRVWNRQLSGFSSGGKILQWLLHPWYATEFSFYGNHTLVEKMITYENLRADHNDNYNDNNHNDNNYNHNNNHSTTTALLSIDEQLLWGGNWILSRWRNTFCQGIVLILYKQKHYLKLLYIQLY